MKDEDLIELYNIPEQINVACYRCITGKPNFCCPNYLKCQYQKKYKANIVINEYEHEKEILFFKDAFWQRGGTVNTNADRTRNFIIDDNGVLSPKNADISIFKLQNTIIDSRKRAIDNFYGYVRANKWEYFVTFTVANSSKIDRTKTGQAKYVWRRFRQKLQYYFKNIKIIAVPEFHKNTPALHFHGLMGDCKLDKFLTIAINSAKTYKDKQGVEHPNEYYLQPYKTSFGDQVYNLDPKFFDLGFVTIVRISDFDFSRISNYCAKYLLKQNAVIKYNQKTYFRTHNLLFRNRQVSFLTEEQKNELFKEVNLLNLKWKKETEKMIAITIKK
jgi:hypothetical protein